MASPRCRCTPRSRRRSPCNGTPLVPRRRPSSRRSLPTQPALRFAPSPFCQIKWNVSISESRKNIGKKYLFSDVFKNKNRVKKGGWFKNSVGIIWREYILDWISTKNWHTKCAIWKLNEDIERIVKSVMMLKQKLIVSLKIAKFTIYVLLKLLRIHLCVYTISLCIHMIYVNPLWTSALSLSLPLSRFSTERDYK